MKQKVRKTIHNEIIETYGTPDTIIESLQKAKERYGADCTIYFTTSGYDSPDVEITYEREETDEECAARMLKEFNEAQKKLAASEKKQKKLMQQREKERAEYERLKAIYGRD